VDEKAPVGRAARGVGWQNLPGFPDGGDSR